MAQTETVMVEEEMKTMKIVDDGLKKNRIQVSNTKKPLFFYLNLAKRYIKQHNDVELSALGMAIPTVVTIAEILKANGVAVEKKVFTSTVGSKDENKGRMVQKAKIEILLEKVEKSGEQPTETAEAKPQMAESKTDIEVFEMQTEAETKAKAEAAESAEKNVASAENKNDQLALTH